MSYQAQAGFFDFLMGGSGTSGKDLNARPGNLTDFLKLHQVIKEEAFNKFGYYKNPDGSPMYGDNRMAYPVLTVQDGVALLEYWMTVCKTAITYADKAKDRLMALKMLNAALDRFRSRYLAWKQTAYATATEYQGRAMGMKTTELLLNYTIGNLAIELDNMSWAAWNIESPANRIAWAVGSSAKDVVVGITKGVASVVDSAGSIMKFGFDITKWAIVAAVAIGGVWLVSKMKGSGE